MIDYATLRIIWWLLLGIIIIGFAVTDGFDLGVAILHPFVGRKDKERRIVINTVGPVWEGNQVWFILAGGATFAAWPYLYAISFSGFYLAMFLVLAGLILRPVSFKYRSKVSHPVWRTVWDWLLFLSGFIPTLIFGVAVGNVIQGVPFHFDETLRAFYTGSFIDLLNPFALLCGFLSICMFIMHGGLYLGIKTENPIRHRAIAFARVAAILVIILFLLGGWWVTTYMQGFAIKQIASHVGPSNPLYKQVITHVGAWIWNYDIHPYFLIAPIIGIVGALCALIFANVVSSRIAFVSSCISLIGIITTFGASIFPFILPSSTNPNESLTVWDASSSQFTLFIMLIATIIFIPIILAYTTWVYRVMRGKVTDDFINSNKSAY